MIRYPHRVENSHKERECLVVCSTDQQNWRVEYVDSLNPFRRGREERKREAMCLKKERKREREKEIV